MIVSKSIKRDGKGWTGCARKNVHRQRESIWSRGVHPRGGGDSGGGRELKIQEWGGKRTIREESSGHLHLSIINDWRVEKEREPPGGSFPHRITSKREGVLGHTYVRGKKVKPRNFRGPSIGDLHNTGIADGQAI